MISESWYIFIIDDIIHIIYVMRCQMISYVPSIRPAVSGPTRASYDGYCAPYDTFCANEPKSENKAVQHLLSSQHTATRHFPPRHSWPSLSVKTPALETYVIHVKRTVFGVKRHCTYPRRRSSGLYRHGKLWQNP
jgi:hypothetical protein